MTVAEVRDAGTRGRIAVVGGGAAGLFGARLLARTHPEWRVELFERLPPNETFGFGVGLTGALLDAVRDTDREVYDAIIAVAFAFSSASFRLPHGAVALSSFHHGVSIGRAELLRVLLECAQAAGVETHIGVDVDALALRDDYDLVVAADGVGSRARHGLATELGASVELGRGLFIWCGSETELPGATFIPVVTDDGVFVAHAYPFAAGRSTWVIETDTGSRARAGLDRFDVDTDRGVSDQRSLDYLSDAFADLLGGHRLLGNGSRWAHFRTVRCDRWFSGNVVLLGDAVATAHPSLGSGTKLAMEAAMALADALRRCDGSRASIPSALRDYQDLRCDVVDRLQLRAIESQRWWESFPARMHLNPARVAVSFMSRGGAVTLDDLRKTDLELVRAATADYASTGHGGVPADVSDAWILEQKVELPGGSTPRLVTDLASIRITDRVHVDCSDAWGPAGDGLLDRVRPAAADRTGVVVVEGNGTIARFAFAERIRLELAVPVLVCVTDAELRDGIDGLVAARADLLHVVDSSAGAAQ